MPGVNATRDMYQQCEAQPLVPTREQGDFYTLCNVQATGEHIWAVGVMAVQLAWVVAVVRLEAALGGRP